MPDDCMNEFEDTVWKDMYQCNDHVVPSAKNQSFQCNSRKRPHREARYIEAGAGELPFVQQSCPEKREEANLTTIHQRSSMLEKETWSMKSNKDILACNSESNNEDSSLASDSTKMPNNCFMSNLQSSRSEICVGDSILSDKNATVSNSFDQMDQISEANNDLSFFGNTQEGKPSNELLHYSWADIGNFDDVDRMFRSYDSTFGKGTSHADSLGRFSSSNATGGSEYAFKLDSKFSCPDSNSLSNMLTNDDTSRFSSATCSISELAMQNSSIMHRGNTCLSVRGESGEFGDLSFSSGSGSSGNIGNKDNFMLNPQYNEQNAQPTHQNQPGITENDQYLENNPIFYVENLAESGQRQAETLESQSCGYLQGDTPYMSSDYNCRPDQTPLHPHLFAIKSENSRPTSISMNDSCPLDQMESTEGSKESSIQMISSASEKTGQLHHQRGVQASMSVNPEYVGLAVQASTSSNITKKAVNYSSESHIDCEVKVGKSFDSEPSAQYSSMSSGLGDISLEATSFRQLQNVMERLDLRTKLCIRDSLYRLARSAEQRHPHVNINGVSKDDRDSIPADQRNKFTNFMDIETETNPIDRSIAHLLFHRPADSSATPNLNSHP